jgi:hypothetical protein
MSVNTEKTILKYDNAAGLRVPGTIQGWKPTYGKEVYKMIFARTRYGCKYKK